MIPQNNQSRFSDLTDAIIAGRKQTGNECRMQHSNPGITDMMHCAYDYKGHMSFAIFRVIEGKAVFYDLTILKNN